MESEIVSPSGVPAHKMAALITRRVRGKHNWMIYNFIDAICYYWAKPVITSELYAWEGIRKNMFPVIFDSCSVIVRPFMWATLYEIVF